MEREREERARERASERERERERDRESEKETAIEGEHGRERERESEKSILRRWKNYFRSHKQKKAIFEILKSEKQLFWSLRSNSFRNCV